ncbi:proteoglycan 4-like [Heterodontus francisci]|uniref:proteoglycan 4-like n=1 Tax=Heterodontus francisci TaxID=7792 RepID=UPI00355BB6FF
MPLRIQRFQLRLMRFMYESVYVQGKQQTTADALSRATVDHPTQQDVNFINEIESYSQFTASQWPMSGRSDDWSEYKEQQRMTQRLIRRKKLEYERKLDRNVQTGSKSFYRYLKRERVSKVSVGPLENHLNDPNLCNKKPSDALTTLQNGTTYVFRGHLFWTIGQKGQALGYPRRISDVWGIPSPIDTVFTRCNCNGNTFFFKGEQYWRFQNGVMDSGYPRSIATGFSGLNGKIRAALSVAAYKNRPETVYFFKNGGRYQKYVYHQRPSTTCAQRTRVYTYQAFKRRFKRQTMVVIQKAIKLRKTVQLSAEMSIRKNWRGFPVRITSAISFPNPERVDKYEYFVLSGDKYYTVDPVNQKATNTSSIKKDLYGCH